MNTILEEASKKIISLWKTDEQGDLQTPSNAEATFKLTYQTLEVGTLSLKKGKWTFAYAEAFKNQDRIKPLTNFPHKHKIYVNEELYPFFVERIPGLGQPKVQQIIKKENIDRHNEAALLQRFGKVSIANPFQLHKLSEINQALEKNHC